MKNKIMFMFFITTLATTAFAANSYQSDPNFEEKMVLGTCIQQKIFARIPPAKFQQCKNVLEKQAPACLGLTEPMVNSIEKECFAQVNKYKCIAVGLNTRLIHVAACEAEQNPLLCYQKKNISFELISKVKAKCL
jgi:hypothetical protein